MRNRDSRSPAALAHGGVLWRLFELARARGDLRERQGCMVFAILGALECGLGRGATHGRPGGAGGIRRRHGHGAGKLEVGETVSGSFVIFSKFKIQLCKLNFSPSS